MAGIVVGGGGGGPYGVGGPTPWWGSSPQGYQNLSDNAPAGYKYDPVQMKYVRTPTSLGQDQGAMMQGLQSAVPQIPVTHLFDQSSEFDFGSGSSSPSTSGGIYGSGGIPATITGAPLPSQVQYNGTADQVKAIQGPDMTAANAAAFASAKDLTGQTARGALTGLSGAMAGRGIVGSGVEGRGQASIVNTGQQQLGEAARQQAINEAALKEQNALATYQGDVTQRGQNLQNLQFGANLGVTQRGQDIGASEAATNNLTSQRGQDIQLKESEANYGLSQQELQLKRQQAALQGLQGATGYGGPGAY